MRVVLTTPYPMDSATGVATFVQSMVVCLREHGDEATVLGPPSLSSGFHVSSAKLALASARGIFRRRSELDLVHCQQLHVQSLAASVIGRFLRKPVLLTIHGRSPRPSGIRGLAFDLIERLSVWLPNRLVVVAEDLAGQVRRPATPVPIGVPVGSIQALRAEREAVRRELRIGNGPVVMYSGRVTRDKGIPTLLEAFEIVRKFTPGARLVLVGPVDPEIEGDVTTRAEQRGILALGARPDVHRLLSVADVYVLASTREGMPFSLVEAMAAGLPVVATTVGDVPKIVQSMTTGLLSPPGDANRLAESIRWCLDHAEQSQAMGRSAARFVTEHLDARTMCGKYRLLYEQEVSASSRASSAGRFRKGRQVVRGSKAR